MKPYHITDWYWVIGGDESRVYSSRISDYVAASDATYRAWLADGGLPTRILNEAELGEVLSSASIRPTVAGILDGYQSAKARRLTIGDIAKMLLDLNNRVSALDGGAVARDAADFRDRVIKPRM